MSERAGWALKVETHRKIEGRSWRVSDPRILEALRQLLVNELMSARRAVGAAKRSEDQGAERGARDRVHDAKVALGERGEKWWLEDVDDASVADRSDRARRALARVELGAEWTMDEAVAAVVSPRVTP